MIELSNQIDFNPTLTGNNIVYDRIFWIYFIVTFFAAIIGMTFIISSESPYFIPISVLWLLSIVALLIMVYHASIIWAPTDPNDSSSIVCFVDNNSGCFNSGNRVWLLVNILYLLILLLLVIWTFELSSDNTDPLRTMSGIMIILLGLLLASLTCTSPAQSDQKIYSWNFSTGQLTQQFIFPFWISITFLLIWFVLTTYITIS